MTNTEMQVRLELAYEILGEIHTFLRKSGMENEALMLLGVMSDLAKFSKATDLDKTPVIKVSQNELSRLVDSILDSSDFNSLPFEERKKICRYTSEQQILTLYHTLIRNKEHTTSIWKMKQREWLMNCIRSYQREWGNGDV